MKLSEDKTYIGKFKFDNKSLMGKLVIDGEKTRLELVSDDEIKVNGEDKVLYGHLVVAH